MMSRDTLAAVLLILVAAAPAPAAWQYAWSVDLPARKSAWEYTPRMVKDTAYDPVPAGHLVLVGCEHDGSVRALDTATGAERWRFYTNGPVRVAPVVDGQRVFVGSDDGRLYCLGLDGTVRWTFRGAGADRLVLGHERLMSTWPISARPVVHGGKVFVAAGYWPVDGVYVHALDAETGTPAWSTAAAEFRPFGVMKVIGNTLFVDGHPSGGGYDLATGAISSEKKPAPPPKPPAGAAAPAPPPPPETPGVRGTIARRVPGDGVLLVATSEGGVYCFTDKPGAAPAAAQPAAPAAPADGAKPAPAPAGDLFGVKDGYCLIAGLTDGAVVERAVRTTNLTVFALDADAAVVAAVRKRAADAGLFDGRRLSVIHADPEAAGLPPYVASLVLSEKPGYAFGPNVRECVRPYGGLLVEGGAGNGAKVTRRDGPLPGAADWTHEFCDPGMTLASKDQRVRGPLGVLWYGGPAADARLYFDGGVDHQSGDGLNPQPVNAQILDGRMFIQAPGVLAAVDVYTGRILWEAALPKVYPYGGKEGGLGIHSKKHPRPWESPEALKAEVHPTHRARSSGFNYVSTRDGIYVAAGRTLIRIDPATGKENGRWPVPLPSADAEQLCWGSLWTEGDVLVATAFRPADLVAGEAGHDGNGGDWAGDRMPMGYLLALDRTSHKPLWSRKAEWGFLNRGTALGNGTVFCLDEVMEDVLKKWKANGRPLAGTPPTVSALDLRTGKPKWSMPVGVLVKNLHYSAERDVLLVANRHLMEWADGDWAATGKPGKNGKLELNANGRMRGVRGSDGTVLWDVNEAPYYNPHVVLGDLLIDRNGVTYDLATGKRATRTSPLTGTAEPWSFAKSGCVHLVACSGLVTWRTAYYDLAGHSGAVKLAGMDSGCSPTLIPANGVLNVPNLGTHHKRNRMTAMAMVHRPQNDNWANFATASGKGDKPAAGATPAEPPAVVRVAVNLGAPGDRVASDGTLWLGAGGKPNQPSLATFAPKDARAFSLPPTAVDGHWAAASGLIGLTDLSIPTRPTAQNKEKDNKKKAKQPEAAEPTRRYTVRLYFAEPELQSPGQRVFTVSLEGKPVLDQFDVARAAGGRAKAVVKELRGVDVAGPLDVTLTPAKGEAILSAVELVAE